eukprot:CAMPEP_0171111588 /NCGR_PEP_ID=MMETSP0766_2-20121228/75657_1 /TAXON_ID=439317 /ORGANISM="Gambierdiscus australes, Strain CAWD 149" /LENGTH=139 /DNA_ID=CAMNT_0011573589 /DNA_START=30 /DNA_END=450 /DNA_ORIENTATION=+
MPHNSSKVASPPASETLERLAPSVPQYYGGGAAVDACGGLVGGIETKHQWLLLPKLLRLLPLLLETQGAGRLDAHPWAGLFPPNLTDVALCPPRYDPPHFSHAIIVCAGARKVTVTFEQPLVLRGFCLSILCVAALPRH